MKKILLVTIGLSAMLFAGFTRNGNIVTDTTTGLQWQDNTEAKTVTKTWIEAINYCENLTLGGYNDWRLPNINELKSIVDRSKSNPAIVDTFINVVSSVYWSSTTIVEYKGNAWVVNFDDGNVHNGYKYSRPYVRCVRAGQ